MTNRQDAKKGNNTKCEYLWVVTLLCVVSKVMAKKIPEIMKGDINILRQTKQVLEIMGYV